MKYWPCGKMWNNLLRKLWNLMLAHQVKWNKSPYAAAYFTLRSNISHAKRISQIPQGIYFVEKDRCFVSKHRSFSGGEGGIWTLDTLLGYTRFPIVRARPATRLLHRSLSNQPVYITTLLVLCQVLICIILQKLFRRQKCYRGGWTLPENGDYTFLKTMAVRLGR